MTNTGAGYQQWREAVAVCTADTDSGPYPECIDCDTGGYMREPDQCAKCRHLREAS